MDKTHLDPSRTVPRATVDPLCDLRSLGEYRLLRRLGEGGMGAVYLGYHEGRDLQVAIKVLGDQLASSQNYIDRFYREAKSGQLLSHPNIVRTLDVGQDRATAKHYLVLEFVDGPSAHALLDRLGKLSVGDAVHVALDIARALEHAHSRRIVHRDIKPDNILISRAGVCKLVDLGLAKRIDEASHLTAARQGFGTTAYMPYEQAINAKYADGRSDIYALGATLYHLVTGAVPFPGENHLEVIEKKNLGDFPPAASLVPAVPATLDAILARMLARQPRDRYQTASELIVDLERSRLAAPVPSFADPDLARKDPWVQKCIESSAEPTRADPEMPPGNGPLGVAPEDTWLLHFRNAAGREVTRTASTQQIARLLRQGRLPTGTEARRPDQPRFQPLNRFAEFRSIRPDLRPKRPPVPPPAGKDGAARAHETNGKRPSSPKRRTLWLGLAGGLVLLVVVLAVLFKFVL
jgi:serine/threonine-protein kinase